MRVCNCPGILAKAEAAFIERLLGWARLGARRPTRIGVTVVCKACGRVWSLELRAKGPQTAARRQLLGAA